MQNLQQRIYSTHRIVAMVAELRDQGISPARVLQGTGLTPSDLTLLATRVSYDQVIRACRNTLSLSTDPAVGLRAGQRMHVTSYGMYGYAILSSRSTRESCDFSVKYHNIVGPIIEFDYDWQGEEVVWSYITKLLSDPADPLYRFSVEFGMASHLTVMQDVHGPALYPLQARLAYAAPEHREVYREVLGCSPQFDAGQNQLVFDALWMRRPMVLANSVTHAAMRDMCEQLLQQMDDDSATTAAQVRSALLRHPGSFPKMVQMAAQLGLKPWTLRRRLASEGCSYRRLLAEVRERLALEYLQSTRLTHEEIAARLGYSDASNFRQAFVRWTRKNPSDFRKSS